jgi:hypothetical protein
VDPGVSSRLGFALYHLGFRWRANLAYTVHMAPRPQRYTHHLSARIADEHQVVLDRLQERLEAECDCRLHPGDVLRWLLEQRAVKRMAAK